jgi:hypothetical protein
MALIRGQEVQEGPKQLPANPRLWNMITTQAKTRFAKYPSPAAAHWVHAKYSQLGGKFVTSKKDIDPRFRDYAKEAQDKKEEAAKKKVTKPVGKNTLHGEGFKKL